MSEANVKRNNMVTTKWTYKKNGVLPVTTLFFKNFVPVVSEFYLAELFPCEYP